MIFSIYSFNNTWRCSSAAQTEMFSRPQLLPEKKRSFRVFVYLAAWGSELVQIKLNFSSNEIWALFVRQLCQKSWKYLIFLSLPKACAKNNFTLFRDLRTQSPHLTNNLPTPAGASRVGRALCPHRKCPRQKFLHFLLVAFLPLSSPSDVISCCC